jgi:hypothetical protein
VRDLVRIGCGAGYSGDRIEPAVELATRGHLDYLVFEALAERTIALAQQARTRDPESGYDPLLGARMEAVLPTCRARGIRVLTNMGAANPRSAAARVRDIAAALDLHGTVVAAVTGDDVLELVATGRYELTETGTSVSGLGARLLSANAYIGAEPLVQALTRGAHVVVAGRAADPSLFVAAQMHALGWAADDWMRLGQGTVVGHLLECAGQVTGGYFADPGRQDVDGLARLGFPLAEVSADGTAVVTKVAGSGGRVTSATCKQQLLYEIHDPARYQTPDVVADFTHVQVADIAPDRVAITGGRGGRRPDQLKVSVGYLDGYIGEGQISYAGAGAVARAKLAQQIVVDRLRLTGVPLREVRCDLIGMSALHGAASPADRPEPYEVRARVAGRTETAEQAERIGREVEALYTNGPAGGGGATRSTRPVLAIGTTFVPRDRVRCSIHLERVP